MRFKDLLAKQGVTQQELATAIGVTQSLISQWVLGKCQPQLQTLPKIAKTLNVDVSELLKCFE